MAEDWIIEQEGDTIRLVAPSGAEIVVAEHDQTFQGRMLFRLARDVAATPGAQENVK